MDARALLDVEKSESKSSSIPDVINELKILPSTITFLTTNIARFPDKVCCIPLSINSYLAPGLVRDPIIARNILKENPDVIAFQEVWSKETADAYKQLFKEQGNYHFVDGGYAKTIVNGGVMIFSKFPIIDFKQVVFQNGAFPEEWYGGKRALCVKLQINADYFITIESHHLHAGCCTLAKKYGGTTTHRRGEQLGQILDEAIDSKDDWWHTPPAGSSLKYLKGFAMGDYNMDLSVAEVHVTESKSEQKENSVYLDNRKLLSVSTGLSSNGMHPNEIKNGGLDDQKRAVGQYGYFKKFEPNNPENYVNSRPHFPLRKGARKQIDITAVQTAREKNLYTGTDRAHLQNIELKSSESSGAVITIEGNSPQSPRKLIDGIFRTYDGEALGQFTTQIISLDGSPMEVEDMKETIPVSDHFALRGVWDLTKEFKSPKTIYDQSQPEPFAAIDPSAGCKKGGCCCCKKLTTRFSLFPKIRDQQPETSAPVIKLL